LISHRLKVSAYQSVPCSCCVFFATLVDHSLDDLSTVAERQFTMLEEFPLGLMEDLSSAIGFWATATLIDQ